MIPYKKIGEQIGKLVEEKNAAYGDSFSKSQEILKILYPNGIQPEQYQDVLTSVRILDKLFRIATRKDAFGESPYRDIAGYGILGFVNDIHEKIRKEADLEPEDPVESDLEPEDPVESDLEPEDPVESEKPTRLRDSLEIFAQAMEEKLQKNDKDKVGWEHLSRKLLFSRLLEETDELRVALTKIYSNPEERHKNILEECTDVSNFAMMIFSKYHPVAKHGVRGFIKKRLPRMAEPKITKLEPYTDLEMEENCT